jgi:hypothetical protein
VSVEVKITGLREFNKRLKALDAGLPKATRLALNDAGDVIVDDARPRVPSRSGRARRTVRARSTRTKVRVAGGGSRAPYYPWLDFGGRVGPGRSVRRPVLNRGRYIYAAFDRHRDEFVDVLDKRLREVADDAGLQVT